MNARKLSDGGLLIQLNGRSHVTYAKVRSLLCGNKEEKYILMPMRPNSWRTDEPAGGGCVHVAHHRRQNLRAREGERPNQAALYGLSLLCPDDGCAADCGTDAP